MPSITLAKAIAPSDTSTSVVIGGSGPQIRCGKVQLTTYRDIVYAISTSSGTQIPLKLDVVVPQSPGRKPLVVYITGGGFLRSDKTANLDQRTYVAEQGYVVASIEYRTVPSGATYRDSVADIKSAIRYLRAHADQYDNKASKVAVWGASAGGHLAAMTGVTHGIKAFDDSGNPGQSSTVHAVVDEFGPSDISTVASDHDTATQKTAYAAVNTFAPVAGWTTRTSSAR
jgi:acetyl esterase/lipase